MSKKMKAVFDAARNVKQSYSNDGISNCMARYDHGLLESVQNLVEAVDEYEAWINDDRPTQLDSKSIDEQEAKLMDWVPFALTKENDK